MRKVLLPTWFLLIAMTLTASAWGFNRRCPHIISAYSIPNIVREGLAAAKEIYPELSDTDFTLVFERAVTNLTHAREFRRELATQTEIARTDILSALREETQRFKEGKTPDVRFLAHSYGAKLEAKGFADLSFYDFYRTANDVYRANAIAFANARGVTLPRISRQSFVEHYFDFAVGALWASYVSRGPAWSVNGGNLREFLTQALRDAIAGIDGKPIRFKRKPVTPPDEFTENILRQFYEHGYDSPRSPVMVSKEQWIEVAKRLRDSIAGRAQRLGFARTEPILSLRFRGYRFSELRREVEFEFLRAAHLGLDLDLPETWSLISDHVADGFLHRMEKLGRVKQSIKLQPQVVAKTSLRVTANSPAAKAKPNQLTLFKNVELRRWQWMARHIPRSVRILAGRYGVTEAEFWDVYTESDVLAQIGTEAARWKQEKFTIASPVTEANQITDEAVRLLMARLISARGIGVPDDWMDQFDKRTLDRQSVIARMAPAEVQAILSLWEKTGHSLTRRQLFVDTYVNRVPLFMKRGTNVRSSVTEAAKGFRRFMMLREVLQRAPSLLSAELRDENAEWVKEMEQKLRRLRIGYSARKSKIRLPDLIAKLDDAYVAGQVSDRPSFLKKIDEIGRAAVKEYVRARGSAPPPGSSDDAGGRLIPAACHVRPESIPLTDIHWRLICRRIPEYVDSEGEKYGVTWADFWNMDDFTGAYTGEDVVHAIAARVAEWKMLGLESAEGVNPETEIGRSAIRNLMARLYRANHPDGPPENWRTLVKEKRIELLDVFLMLPVHEVQAIRPLWDSGLQLNTINDDRDARVRLFDDLFLYDAPIRSVLARNPKETSEQGIRSKKMLLLHSFVETWKWYRDPASQVLFLLPPADLVGYDDVWKLTVRQLHKQLNLLAIGQIEFWAPLNARVSYDQWVGYAREELVPFHGKIVDKIGIPHIGREVAQRILVRAGFKRTTAIKMADPSKKKSPPKKKPAASPAALDRGADEATAPENTDTADGVAADNLVVDSISAPHEAIVERPVETPVADEQNIEGDRFADLPTPTDDAIPLPLKPGATEPAAELPLTRDQTDTTEPAASRPLPAIPAALRDPGTPVDEVVDPDDLSHIDVPRGFTLSTLDLAMELAEELPDKYRVFHRAFLRVGSVNGRGKYVRYQVEHAVTKAAQRWKNAGLGNFKTAEEQREIAERAIRDLCREWFFESGQAFPAAWSHWLADGVSDARAIIGMIPDEEFTATFAAWEKSEPAPNAEHLANFRKLFVEKIPTRTVFSHFYNLEVLADAEFQANRHLNDAARAFINYWLKTRKPPAAKKK